MSKFFAVIDTTRDTIISNYYGDDIDPVAPGPDYDQTKLVHLQVPEEFHSHFIKVVKNGSSYDFQFDQAAIDRATADQWSWLREQRDKKLAACDWTVTVSDRPLSDDKKAEWIAYRQALRDLPANTPDPANPTWPTPPN
jgi:hypothetical protein